MARFQFKALDAGKLETSGTFEAPDRDAALESLSKKYDLVIDVKELKAPRGLFARSISTEEIMVVTQQLAVMLRSGMNLKHCLEVVDTESPALQVILAEISAGVSEGKTLSELFERYPRVFSGLYTSMVRAGETAGQLPGILLKLAEYLESAENLKRKVKAALVYPVAVITVAFVISIFIFMFGVKQFQEIYAGFNVELPAMTLLVMGLADLLWKTWYILILVAVAAFYALRRYLETNRGEYQRDRLLLNLPIVGSLMRRLAIARFAKTLSTLQAGGVPILASLDLVATSMGNRVMEDVIRNALKSVREGESLAGPLRESKAFTRMAISMIASGEESGTLDTMLEEVADFYEIQVEIMLRSLTSLLEPLIIVAVGVFVAILIVALGMPMLNLVKVLG